MSWANVLVWTEPDLDVTAKPGHLSDDIYVSNMEALDDVNHILVSLMIVADDLDAAMSDILATFESPVLVFFAQDQHAMVVDEDYTDEEFAAAAVSHAADVLTGDERNEDWDELQNDLPTLRSLLDT